MLEFLEEHISKNYTISKVKRIDLTKFEEVIAKAKFKLHSCYEISTGENQFYCCMAEYMTYFPDRSRIDTNKLNSYFFGFVKLNESIGKLSLRPETIGDKIAEFFSSKELDFESHKKFSNKYYLLASNPDLVRKKFSNEMLDLIAKHENVIMECNLKKCLFRLNELPARKEDIEDFINMGLSIDKHFNGSKVMWPSK
jgi:hypothetical protein